MHQCSHKCLKEQCSHKALPERTTLHNLATWINPVRYICKCTNKQLFQHTSPPRIVPTAFEQSRHQLISPGPRWRGPQDLAGHLHSIRLLVTAQLPQTVRPPIRESLLQYKMTLSGLVTASLSKAASRIAYSWRRN